MAPPEYQEGYDAYYEQIEREDCPYPEGSDEAYEWGKGWDAACNEDYRRNV